MFPAPQPRHHPAQSAALHPNVHQSHIRLKLLRVRWRAGAGQSKGHHKMGGQSIPPFAFGSNSQRRPFIFTQKRVKKLFRYEDGLIFKTRIFCDLKFVGFFTPSIALRCPAQRRSLSLEAATPPRALLCLWVVRGQGQEVTRLFLG